MYKLSSNKSLRISGGAWRGHVIRLKGVRWRLKWVAPVAPIWATPSTTILIIKSISQQVFDRLSGVNSSISQPSSTLTHRDMSSKVYEQTFRLKSAFSTVRKALGPLNCNRRFIPRVAADQSHKLL